MKFEKPPEKQDHTKVTTQTLVYGQTWTME